MHSINFEKIATQLLAPSLDHKTLSDATADLKKRATRIKDRVPLLQVADKGGKIRYDEDPGHLPTMLPELNRLITSFLDSPVFRLSSPNDPEVRLKASRDLDGIIKLRRDDQQDSEAVAQAYGTNMNLAHGALERSQETFFRISAGLNSTIASIATLS